MAYYNEVRGCNAGAPRRRVDRSVQLGVAKSGVNVQGHEGTYRQRRPVQLKFQASCRVVDTRTKEPDDQGTSQRTRLLLPKHLGSSSEARRPHPYAPSDPRGSPGHGCSVDRLPARPPESSFFQSPSGPVLLHRLYQQPERILRPWAVRYTSCARGYRLSVPRRCRLATPNRLEASHPESQWLASPQRATPGYGEG